MPINRWMDKDNMVHIYNGILLIYKKEWNCAICRDVDGPRDCQSKVSQKEKNKYCISSVQSLSCIQLSVTPWTGERHASLSITSSGGPSKPMSIVSVMPYSHLILCHHLLLLPSIFPSIRGFSNRSTLSIRWRKYWSFSFNISPSNEHPGLISFRMDWLDLLAVQGTLKSLL